MKILDKKDVFRDFDLNFTELINNGFTFKDGKLIVYTLKIPSFNNGETDTEYWEF